MPQLAGGLSIIEFYLWNKRSLIQWIHSSYIKYKALDSIVTSKQPFWLISKNCHAIKWFPNQNASNSLHHCCANDKFSIKIAYRSFMPQ
ncbi:hypothetical protein H5410_061779 [Solanum commersonii]|uniref:Uncharacterized protein n=1 Tax=Solanum commersonii TaxID=4109 RepID=A0A9J5W8U2_SOLCO|nr:hypothetical protein H5410_061779 [Solanum commersonii]